MSLSCCFDRTGFTRRPGEKEKTAARRECPSFPARPPKPNIYGLETVVSVSFSNTRTRLLYNEREIFAILKFRVHCTASKCVYLKTEHELTVSNAFNIQFEFTAGDRLTMASRPNTAQFL